MMPLLLALLLVTAGNVLLVLPRRSDRSLLRKGGILLFAELILLYAFHLALFRFTLCTEPEIPLFSFASLLLGSSVLFLQKAEHTVRLCRFLRTAVKCICLALLLEFTVFSAGCYSIHPTSRSVPLADARVKGNAEPANGGIRISGNTQITVPLELCDVRHVVLAVESEDVFYQIACRMTDENFSLDPQKIGERWMNPSQYSVRFAVSPYGTIHEVQLQFSEVKDDAPVQLSGMTVSNVRPYRFSLLRVLLLAGILCLLAAVRIFRWHRICYDRGNLLHREAIAAMLIACVFALLSTVPLWEAYLVPYDPAAGADPYDPYAQTFDAWQRGQLHLETEVDPVLAELENPYDRSVRHEAGADAEWDKAFYNGKYYSYFGIAPVVFVYYPIWLCTGKLPTPALAAAVFSAAGMVFLILLLLTLLRRYCRRVNLLLLLCGIAAAASASGLFLCANYADRYYVAVAAGTCFLCLFLWLGLEAVMANTQRSRCLLLAGCGTAIAAAVLSRPLISLYALLLVPPFWTFIRRKDLHVRCKVAAAASFAVPLVIGAAVTMTYNAARFSSPLDFGSTYQLTVSNIAANRISLREFPAALVYYFLNPVQLGGTFPYITQYTPIFAQNGHYVYLADGFGAFMFFCIPAAFLLPARMSGKPEQRAVCITAFVLPVLIAFLDYCMGGYNTRYLCDILPVLAVFSVFVILDAQHRRRKSPAVRKAAFLLFLQAPVFLTALLLSLSEELSLWRGTPEFYYIVQGLFEIV